MREEDVGPAAQAGGSHWLGSGTTNSNRNKKKEGMQREGTEGRRGKKSYLAHVFLEAGLKHTHGREAPTPHCHIRILIRRPMGVNLV